VRRLGERLDDRDEVAPKALELPVSQRVPLLLLELREDRVREPHQLLPALGRDDQLGPAVFLLGSVVRVRTAARNAPAARGLAGGERNDRVLREAPHA
jgi:hypothetical protein